MVNELQSHHFARDTGHSAPSGAVGGGGAGGQAAPAEIAVWGGDQGCGDVTNSLILYDQQNKRKDKRLDSMVSVRTNDVFILYSSISEGNIEH